MSYSLSGTATQGDDYGIAGVTGTTGTITVPADAASADIAVNIVHDAVEDDGETIVLALVEGSDYALGARRGVTLTIRNDETAEDMALAVRVSVAERSDKNLFRSVARVEPGAQGSSNRGCPPP